MLILRIVFGKNHSCAWVAQKKNRYRVPSIPILLINQEFNAAFLLEKQPNRSRKIKRCNVKFGREIIGWVAELIWRIRILCL